jgi:exodeoxyribonuclease V gamma subunit
MSAFRILTHFDLTALVDQFAREIKSRPQGMDLVSPEYVIVQTPGLKRWLALQCARRNEIFTQASVLMPKQFIMKLGFWLMGAQEKRSAFERDVLPWTLYRLINAGLATGASELDQLKRYAADQESEMRLFSLADKSADIIDQYTLYRPEWIDSWESGKRVFPLNDAEIWQKYLWNRLVAEHTSDGMPSPNRYLRQLSDGLKSAKEEDLHRLPKRLFLFGMSILPPQYLEIFSNLGRIIDVTLYLQVPSIHYYGDLRSDRQIRARHNAQKAQSGFSLPADRSGNRLLRNLGQLGKEFMDLILAGDAQLNELFDFDQAADEENQPGSLLKEMQRDVRTCSDPLTVPTLCEENDWSIRLAACYGPLREVEVLHDLLLDCFAREKNLAPSDVLIVTPDVAGYGPLIAMVFGDAKQKCGASIPYAIADQSLLAEDPIARFAQDVLAAVTGRFEVSAILSLFESASELSGAPVSMQDRDLLKRWCRNSGIRWGYDAPFRGSLQLPPTEEYTWRYGIDRLLAGYAMDDDEKLPEGLYPAVEIEGDGAALLGRLADFVDSLARLVGLSKEPRTVDEWNGLFAPLIRRLLPVEESDADDESEAANAFNIALASLRERSEISGSGTQKFPFAIFMRSIADELAGASSGRGFLGGAVTVAGMLPMRSIPFRVVAMLGMNRGLFPRHTTRPLFDLMSQSPPRPGDRDSLKSDRYVFLESLLAARDRLIITWSGFDSGDGSIMPPSVLVEEFRAHLNSEYRLAQPDGEPVRAGDAVLVSYPLHPFSPRYLSTDPDDALIQTWNRSWFRPPERTGPRKPVFEWEVAADPTEDDSTVDGNAIIKALSDTFTSFLEEGCRIEPPAQEEAVEDTELFDVGNLEEWALRDAILREELSIDQDAVGRLIADGSVPPGSPGRYAIERVRRDVRREFVDRVDGPAMEFGRLNINKEIDSRTYRIRIDTISLNDATAMILEAGKLNAKRRLKFWIIHLFLNLERTVATTFKTLDKKGTFTPLDRKQAVEQLTSYGLLAGESRRRLLPLILETSWAYVGNRVSVDQARDAAWKQLRDVIVENSWKPHNFDRRWADIFGDAGNWAEAMTKIPGGEKAFVRMAEAVFLPLVKSAGEDA